MKKLLSKLLVILLHVCFLLPANAQMFPSRQYTTEDELANSNVYDICHDNRGYLWFATERGVSRFDGYKFTNYLFKEGLGGSIVFGLAQDDKGTVYAATKYDGVYRLDGNFVKSIEENKIIANEQIVTTSNYFYSLRDKRYITVVDLNGKQLQKIAFPENGVIPNCIYKSPDGNVYSGTNSGIYELNGFNQPKKVFEEITLPVHSIYLQNEMWYFGCESVVIATNGTTLNAIKLPEPGNIKRLLVDRNNNIWAATFPQNKLFLIANNRILDVSSKLGLAGASVNKVMEDKEGNIWIATYGKGVFCIHHMFCTNYTSFDGLNNEYITAIEAHVDKSVFIGSYNGLYYLDETGIHAKKLYDNSLEFIKELHGYNNHLFVTVAGIPEKKMYVGDPVINNSQTTYLQASAILIDDDDLYYSHWDKKLWLTSRSQISQETARLVFYDSTAMWSRINKIFKDKKDNIWIGTTRGLYIIDPSGAYQKIDTGFFKTNITAFLYDATGTLLIGSDKGLIKYKNNQWTTARDIKGKNLENITGLVKDVKERVWIGTLNGLFLLDKKTLIQFDTRNTLLSDEINALEYDKKNNFVWVGTTYGLSSINLSLFDKTPVNPPAAIFKSLRATDSIYRDLDINNTLTLPYTSKNFTVRFSAVHFSSPEGIKFLYKFDDGEWQPTTGRQIEFASMPYGKHTLLLKSFGEQEIEGPVATLIINVETPFWATVWFKIMVGIAIGIAAYLILRKRFEAVRKKQQERLELQSKIAELRHQALAASMNPHFIFNALNSIQHFINSHNTEEATDYLGKFARLIRMILDYGGKTFIPLQDELERLNYYLELEKIRFGNKLTFTIDVDPTLVHQQPEIPNMVIQPVVENALWHGLLPANRNGNLHISFAKIDNAIRVIVEDDGIGVNESKRRKKSGHNSLGIQMIRERLDLLKKLSGYQATIMIQDKSDFNPPGQGTIVQINLA